MIRKPCVSSNVRSYGYDPGAEILEVEFTNKRVYQLFKVPIQVYHDLEAATSKGKFYAENLKGRYRTEPVPINAE